MNKKLILLLTFIINLFLFSCGGDNSVADTVIVDSNTTDTSSNLNTTDSTKYESFDNNQESNSDSNTEESTFNDQGLEDNFTNNDETTQDTTESIDSTNTDNQTTSEDTTSFFGEYNEIVVSNVEELRNALLFAKPGDRILVAPGVYKAPDSYTIEYAQMTRTIYFYSQASGTEDNPIIIEAQDPNNKPILEGLSTEGSGYILWINGGHWIIRNLILKNGGKGLMLDEASYSLIEGVEIYKIGDEGLHLRSGTSHVIVRNCIIDSIGLVQPGFGEGIYIGSDNSQWDKYDMHCDSNVIEYTIIKNTGAEGVDIKEGTVGDIVRYTKIYGGMISGENYADSFINLKGTFGRIYGCTFYRENNTLVTRGVAIVDRSSSISSNNPDISNAYDLTANNNWIWDNTFYLDASDGVMVHAYSGYDNYAWNNTRDPAGDEYQGNAPELYIEEPSNFAELSY